MRLKTHWSQPENDGSSEGDGGKDRRAEIVVSYDAPPVSQAIEYDLNAVAASIAALFVFDRFEAGFSNWDAGRRRRKALEEFVSDRLEGQTTERNRMKKRGAICLVTGRLP